MKAVLAIARREYLARVKSKWFLISTIGAPLLVVGFGGFTAYMGSRGSQDERIAVVDRTGIIAEHAVPALTDAGFRIQERTGDAALPERLDAEVRSGELGGYVVLDGETLSRGRVLYRGERRPGRLRQLALQTLLVRAAVEAQFDAEAAEGSADLFRGGEFVAELVGTEDDERARDVRIGFAFVGGTILYVTLIVYGVWLLRAVLEEKTSRMVEVVLASVRPSQLMLGKVVGVGSVGLTQVAAWATLLGIVALAGIPMLIAARPELADMVSWAEFLPGIGVFLLFVVFFVLGFFLYATLYAAAGAMCSTEQEAQQAAQPITILIVVPFFLLVTILEGGGGDSLLAALMSQVPFFSPILMFARASSGVAAAWEVALSIVLLLGAIWLAAVVAGRIYKVGILMQGKRPNLPEIWRWVRTG